MSSGRDEADVSPPVVAASGVTRPSAQSPLHYDTAPIVEAVLGFEIDRLPPEKLALLPRMPGEFGDSYRDVKPIERGKNVSRLSSQDAEGFVFTSEDGKQLIQARSDGFWFSRLTPYDRWEPFIEEARRTWAIYRDIVGPSGIHTFHVRYVNLFLIPLGIPLHEFFNIYPAVPKRQKLFSSMLLFVRYDLEELPGNLTVVMFPSGPGGNSQSIKIGLDNTFRFKFREESAVWENIDHIRRVKNDNFQSQLTDRMRGMLS